jgi:hypothetical protein
LTWALVIWAKMCVLSPLFSEIVLKPVIQEVDNQFRFKTKLDEIEKVTCVPSMAISLLKMNTGFGSVRSEPA